MVKRNRRRRTASVVAALTGTNGSSPELELLAYLTHCRKNLDIPNLKHFKATISDHLVKAVEVSWKLSDVDKRMRLLWKRHHAPGQDHCDYHSLYFDGIRVLHFGDNDLRLKDLIRDRAQQISCELALETSSGRATRSQRVSHDIGLEYVLNTRVRTASLDRGKVKAEVHVQSPASVVSHSSGDLKVR